MRDFFLWDSTDKRYNKEKEHGQRGEKYMATYVISDIHGEYELFIKLLEKIRFTSADTLYVLGDVIDRGPHPIKALLKLMEMPNAVCLVGNHEVMALKCLKFLRQEITESSIEKIDEKLLDNLATWQYNGAETTISEFRRLDEETQLDVLDFMEDFLVYETLTIEGKNYLLVHGGLGNFSPEKDIEDYSLHDIVWERPDYGRQYFENTYLVTGHTPTQLIAENEKTGYIYREKNHIAIDCGACNPSGRLAAICLESGEETYVDKRVQKQREE